MRVYVYQHEQGLGVAESKNLLKQSAIGSHPLLPLRRRGRGSAVAASVAATETVVVPSRASPPPPRLPPSRTSSGLWPKPKQKVFPLKRQRGLGFWIVWDPDNRLVLSFTYQTI